MPTYSKPDVFVSIDLPASSPTIEVGTLTPVVIGEHYFVAKDSYVGDIASASTATFSYPGLPDSTNATNTPLAVDTTGLYKPVFTVITEEGTSVDVSDDVAATASDFTLTGGAPAGALFVSYRARDDRYAGLNRRLLEVSSSDDLINLFGTDGIGPANPLGYALYKMWTREGIAVRGVAVTDAENGAVGSYSATISNLPLAYSLVLDFLKLHDVFAIVPLTTNAGVRDLVRSHINFMSSELGKSERRAICVPEMSGDIVVRGGSSYEVWNTIDDTGAGTTLSTLMSGVSIGDTASLGGAPVLKVADSEFYIKGVAPGLGTIIEGNTFDITNTTFLAEFDLSLVRPAAVRVKSTDSFVVLESGTARTLDITTVGAAGDENLLKISNPSNYLPDGKTHQFVRSIDPVTERSAFVAAYKQLARSYADERLVLVTPESVYDAEAGHDVPSYFVAAMLAVEVCMTGRQPAGAVPGVSAYGFEESKSSLFKSSRYFTEGELDEMAAAGWTFLVNPAAGAPVNTRHTLTTDMSTLETGEFILGVERDFLARTFRNELRKSLRQFRLQTSTIGSVAIRCDAIATTLSLPGSTSRCYEDVEIVSVIQDPDAPDGLLIDVEATHLYPYNRGSVRVRIVL